MRKHALAEELRSSSVNIARASLLYAAAIAYPSLDVPRYLGILDELGVGLANRRVAELPLMEQAEQLADYLALEHRFRGNESDFGDPRNSLLNDVLDRRIGLPITLSAVYISVARRAGLDVYGIALPGHYIVGLRQADETTWLDPFYGGRTLDIDDCVDLISQSTGYDGPLEAEWFEPVTPRAMLARMIQNLKLAYMNMEDWQLAIAAIRQWHIVQPDSIEHLHELGFCYYQLGLLPQAAYYAHSYLEHEPRTPQADMIRYGLGQLAGIWGDLN